MEEKSKAVKVLSERRPTRWDRSRSYGSPKDRTGDGRDRERYEQRGWSEAVGTPDTDPVRDEWVATTGRTGCRLERGHTHFNL